MVLRDDNFATIVAAVEEGRVIYDNLRRFVLFAVAGNIGKVLVMLLWPLPLFLFGLPLPSAVALLPLQLLWLNLLTDGLLGMSMGFEQAEPSVMRRPPVAPNAGIFSDGLGRRAVWIGTLIGLLALGAGWWYAAAGLPQWQTIIFTSLALMQVFQALAIRSNSAPALGRGLFGNRVIWLAVVLVVTLQLAALFLPALAGPVLQLSPPGPADLLVSALLGVIVFAAIELEKAVARRRLGAASEQPSPARA